jgi:hypothetical protein
VSERLAVVLGLAKQRSSARASIDRSERIKRRALACAGYVLGLPGRKKIGITREPVMRHRQLCLAVGEMVDVHQVVWFPTRADAREWELRAHNELRDAHVLGEWYRAEAVDAWLEQQPIGPGAPALARAHRIVVASRTRETGQDA